MSESEIPLIKTVYADWIVAWKSAVILVDEDLRQLSFGPMVQRIEMKYGINDVAKCAQYAFGHKAPADECKCGFNAWHEKEVAYNYMRAHRTSRGGSLIRVGLSGQVVEGILRATEVFTYWGYRASAQLVTDIFFEKRCSYCDAEAHFVGSSDFSWPYGSILKPVCSLHHNSVEHILHLPSLSLNNDVGVHWLRSLRVHAERSITTRTLPGKEVFYFRSF